MEVSKNNLVPTFNKEGVDVSSMVVLTIGITLAGAISSCRS